MPEMTTVRMEPDRTTGLLSLIVTDENGNVVENRVLSADEARAVSAALETHTRDDGVNLSEILRDTLGR